MTRGTSLRQRIRILERDGYRCAYCGRTSKETRLEVDHIVPRARGGSNEPTNLITACGDCNAGKSASRLALPPTADPRVPDPHRPRVRLAPGRVFDPRFDHLRPFEYDCDTCGGLAEAVHFLPGIPAQVVAFACGSCQRPGERWPIVDLFSGRRDPATGTIETGIDALLQLPGGERTAALLRFRLGQARHRDQWSA